MAKNNQDDDVELGNVYEDAVIVAFRDMQWRRWLKEIETFETKQNQPAVQLRALGPDHLHKLDGDAESLFGDVLANQDGRYFVLEFKSARSGHKRERVKTMFIAVGHYLVRADEDDRKRFMGLSRNCHFGVFGTRVPNGQLGAPVHTVVPHVTLDTASNAPHVSELRIQAHRYLDWIHVYARKLMGLPKDERPKSLRPYATALPFAIAMSPTLTEAMKDITGRIESPDKHDLTSLVWPGENEHRYGASADDYIDYLKLLIKIVDGDPRTPITLVAVVKGRILYWTTTTENLRKTLKYWSGLRKAAQTADQATANAAGQQPLKKAAEKASKPNALSGSSSG